MTDRVTEAELKKIETAIADVARPRVLSWWVRAEDEATSIVLSSNLAKRLVVDLRRLRQLFNALADPDTMRGSRCPRNGDGCWWCGAALDAEPPQLHSETCPWSHLEREVLAGIASS